MLALFFLIPYGCPASYFACCPYLKIGGVETLRDIKDAIERRVDSLMAPMFISLCALNPSF